MSPSEESADGPWVGIMGRGDESLSSETGFWESCVYIWTGIADVATGRSPSLAILRCVSVGTRVGGCLRHWGGIAVRG